MQLSGPLSDVASLPETGLQPLPCRVDPFAPVGDEPELLVERGQLSPAPRQLRRKRLSRRFGLLERALSLVPQDLLGPLAILERLSPLRVAGLDRLRDLLDQAFDPSVGPSQP